MSVAELIEALKAFPPETPVEAEYDDRCAGGEVVSVDTGYHGSVVLVVE
jgi:hypothetical protein